MAVKVGDNTVTDAACLSAKPKHVAEVAYKNQVVMDTQEVDYGTVTYLEKIKLQINYSKIGTYWSSKAGIPTVYFLPHFDLDELNRAFKVYFSNLEYDRYRRIDEATRTGRKGTRSLHSLH
ncbi:hypothetical protein LguiB_035272 [Lonicera macranthoides]